MRINIKCSTRDDDVSGSIWTSVIVSLSFTFVFTAYVSIQNLQSSLNQEEGLGVISLSCLYAFIIVSAILAPTVIKFIGAKLAIIIPWVVHIIYTGTNFYPTFSTLIPSSVLMGIVSGFLWTSQSIYIATNGAAMSEASGEDLHTVLSKLNGMFFTMYETTQITGNLISSLVLKQGSYDDIENTTKVCGSQDCPLAANATKIIEPERNIVYILLGIYLAFDVIGLLLTTFFLSPLPKTEWSQKQTTTNSITSCFFVLGDFKLLMLVPLIGFMAMEQAILWTDFTKSFVSCLFGIHKVGFVMAAYGGSTSVFNLIWSRLARFTGRYFLIAFASMINMGIFITLYEWTPDKEYKLYIIAVSWGMSEGIWQTQSNALIALLFPDKIEPAFANYHCWKAIGFTISFATSNILCVSTKLLIAMILLGVSMSLYIAVEIIVKKTTTKEYNIDNKEKK